MEQGVNMLQSIALIDCSFSDVAKDSWHKTVTMLFCNKTIHVEYKFERDSTLIGPDFLDRLNTLPQSGLGNLLNPWGKITKIESCNCVQKNQYYIDFNEYVSGNHALPIDILNKCECGENVEGGILIPKDSNFGEWNEEYIPEGKFANWAQLESGKLLKPGEIFEKWHIVRGPGSSWSEKVLYINENGSLKKEDGKKEEKKSFAEDQVKHLQEEFGLNNEQAWKVVKEAGPGAALKAAVYGKELLAKEYDTDVLLIVLNQSHEIMGYDRSVRVLTKLGVELPEAYRNKTEFFKVIKGARKYIWLKGNKI